MSFAQSGGPGSLALLNAQAPYRLGACWPWLLALLLWISAVTSAQAQTTAPAPTLQIDTALSVRANTPTFPEEGRAANVPLPDLWSRSAREPGPIWYRLVFQVPRATGDAPQGAYLSHVCSDFRLLLNGHVLHTPQPPPNHPEAPPSRPCEEPAVVTLPQALLTEGPNRLDIQVFGLMPHTVASPARIGGLGPVRVGPVTAFEADKARDHLISVELTVVMVTAVGLVGLAALALARVSRLTYLGFFGVAALSWALWVSVRMGVVLPMAPHLNEALMTATLPPVAVFAVLFLLRYCGVHLPWLDTALWTQCLIVPLSLAVAMPDRLNVVAHSWPLILIAEVVGALIVFVRRAWLYSRPDFWLMALSLGVTALALIAEWSLPDHAIELPGKQAIGAGLVVLFGGMSLRLLQRYHGEVIQAQQACATLEHRLQEATAAPVLDEEAAREAEERAEKRAEQAAAQERKRIAADLHDDLGAKLLTIVHTSDNDRISTLAREALEEMRLSVRGLAGKPVAVGDAVGDWRSEAMSRLSAGGIELLWTVADDVLLSDRRMSARAYVQTTRILREAVSNLLKHSGATHTEISIQVDANDFELLIVDNGKGIPMELDGKLDRGHGMSTMKSRAKQLQGQCLVESGPGFGTTIRLTLPL